MADGDTEIITLSSDDESKAKVPTKSTQILQNINTTLPRKSIQKMKSSKCVQSANNSKDKHPFLNKQAILSRNGKLIELPVNKHPTIITLGNKRSIKSVNNTLDSSAKCKSYTVQQSSKVLPASSVAITSQNFHNSKSSCDVQNRTKRHNIAPSISPLYLNSKPSSSKVIRVPSNLNARQGDIPSVLSSLLKNGISVTNVNKSNNETNVPYSQLKSQQNLDSIKHNLKKNNTRIKVVPPNKNEIFNSSAVVKSNSLCRASIKSKRKYPDTIDLDESLCVKNSNMSSQDITSNYKKKCLELIPLTNTSGEMLSSTSQFKKNSNISNHESSPKSNAKADPSKSGLLASLSSKKALTITRVGDSNKTHKENALVAASHSSSQQKLSAVHNNVNKCSEKKSNPNLTVIPVLNSSVSIKVLNSTRSSQSTENVKNSSSSSAGKKLQKQQYKGSKQVCSAIKTKSSVTTSKNIDVANDRSILLNLLSLCEPTSNNNRTECQSIMLSDTIQNTLPVIKKPSDYKEPIKLKDVPNIIKDWLQPVILLEKIEALEEYITKEIIPVHGTPVFPETNELAIKDVMDSETLPGDSTIKNSPGDKQLGDFTEKTNCENVALFKEKDEKHSDVAILKENCLAKVENVNDVTSGSCEKRFVLVPNNLCNAVSSKTALQVSEDCYINSSNNATVNISENVLNKIINYSSKIKKNTDCLEDSELIKTTLDHIVKSVDKEVLEEICLETCNLMVNTVASFSDNHSPVLKEDLSNVQLCRLSVYKKLMEANRNYSSCISLPVKKSSEQSYGQVQFNSFSSSKHSLDSYKIYESSDIEIACCSTVEKSSDCPSPSKELSQKVSNVKPTVTTVPCSKHLYSLLSCPSGSVDNEASKTVGRETKSHKQKHCLTKTNCESENLLSIVQDCIHDVLQQLDCTFQNAQTEMEWSLSGQSKTIITTSSLSDKAESLLKRDLQCILSPVLDENIVSNDKEVSLDIAVQKSECISESIIKDGFSEKENETTKKYFKSNKCVFSSNPEISLGVEKDEKISKESCMKSFSGDKQREGISEYIELKENMFPSDPEISLGVETGENMSEEFSKRYLISMYTNDEQDAENSVEEIFISGEDEERSTLLNKQVVTSPKLSLRRKRDDKSPENKNSESAENSTLNSKKVKLDRPDLASFSKQEPPTQALLNEVHKEMKNKNRFMAFLEYSKTLMEETSEEEKAKIVKRIVHQLNSTQQWYLSSENFNSLLDDSWSKLREDSSNIFPVLYEMKQDLKKYKCKLKAIPNGKEDNREQTSLSFKNTINKGNAFSSPSTSNDSRPISEANENSVSKSNIEEKKFDSQSADSLISLHSTPKAAKFTVSNHVIKGKVICPKTTTSASALLSESTQNSVFDKNIIEKVNHLPISQRKVVENKSDFFPPASTSGLCSSTETSLTDNNLKNIVILDCKSLSPSLKSNVVQSYVRKEDQKHLFPVASTSGLCSSKEIVKPTVSIDNICEKKVHSDCKSFPSTSYASPSGYNDVESVGGNDGVKPMAAQDARQAARIKRLEDVLAKLDKAIKKCQQRELTLDDMDDPDSAYMKEEKYKKRFNLVWKKLCELKKITSRTGRIVEKRFNYEGSRYKLINSAVQRLVDKKKVFEKFPDFSDLLSTLRQVNDTNQMGLCEKEISVEAERVFKDVGLELQIRRCRDDKELFGCYLTDNIDLIDDPAEKDENLKNTLAENNKKFEASINEIIDTFAMKQQKIANSGEANQEESDDDDDDDEEEDEDENQEKAYNVEDDLPLTDPASPDVSDKCRKESSDDDEVMEIQNDSDRSTEPTDEIEEQIVKKERFSMIKTTESNVLNTIFIEDSISSSSGEDLPSLAELLTR